MKTPALLAHSNKNLLATLTLGLAFAVVFASLSYHVPSAKSASGAITGWMWSSNIGWISLSSTNSGAGSGAVYGLTLNADQTITGHAWSSNVGWISFNYADTASCGAQAATLNGSGTMIGWAKVLATNVAGGFDGCISLSSGTSPVYGITTATNPGYDSNFAWGSTVVGWVSSNAVIPICNPVPPSTCNLDNTVSTNSCGTPTPCSPFYPCDSSGSCGIGGSPGTAVLSLAPPNEDLLTTKKVASGKTGVMLYWNAPGATSCTLRSDANSDNLDTAVNASITGPVASSTPTSAGAGKAITQKTTYTLVCLPSTVGSASVIINVAPSFEEI